MRRVDVKKLRRVVCVYGVNSDRLSVSNREDHFFVVIVVIVAFFFCRRRSLLFFAVVVVATHTLIPTIQKSN